MGMLLRVSSARDAKRRCYASVRQPCVAADVPASFGRSHRCDEAVDFRAPPRVIVGGKIPAAERRGQPMKMTAIAAAIAIAVGGNAYAQGYPSHPITMIVPFPAGGPTDTLARVLGERMRVSLGQPVIIETVTGAGASIGVARAAQAAPDGYTLSIGNWTSHVGAGA